MSELSVPIAPTPELLNLASAQAASLVKGAGAASRSRPDAAAPADGSNGGKPFAALLSAFLQGAQPATPATGPSDPATTAAPLLEVQSEDGTAAVALLALPPTATPLTGSPGGLSGNTLPVSGNLLPVEPALPAGYAASSPGTGSAPDTGVNPATVPAATKPGAKPAAISLADLALSRPLEAAPGSTAAVDRASADPTALALAGRSLALREARASQPESAAQPLAAQPVTQGLTQSLAAAPETSSAGRPALRRTAAEFLRSPIVPGAATEFLSGQLASFAASGDGARASSGPAPTAGTEPTGAANAGQLARLGNTTLPALQPLGDASSFAGALADRLLTLGGPGSHSARLQLHPEHLGELNVEIQIDDGSAQVWFGTTTSQARDAIEASLPRLRELFADQGLALTRTQVDGGSGQLGSQGSDQQRRMAPGGGVEADLPWRTTGRARSSPLAGLLPPTRPSTRLVDAWA